jgi:uncharacterized membrane protein (DUF485 family)
MKNLLQNPEYQRLAAKKRSLSYLLTILMLLAYFSFILLLAFGQDVLNQRVGSTTLGIPFGIGVIIFAWILTGIYVRWANNNYDKAMKDLKDSQSVVAA